MREHKFKHSFLEPQNPFCSSGTDAETNTHFFLYCPFSSNQRCTLLTIVNDIYSSLANTNVTLFTHILLFDKASLDISANTLIRNATINYIISKNRFEKSLSKYFVIFFYIFVFVTLLCILIIFSGVLFIHIHLVFRFSFIIY